MDDVQIIERVKANMRLETQDYDVVISDIIQSVKNYCNLDELPDALEPFVRRKTKRIVDYEAVNGPGYTQEIARIKEGDGSITYTTDGASSRNAIYNMTDEDRSELRRFRRLRGYA